MTGCFSEPIRRFGFACPLGRDPSRTIQRIVAGKKTPGQNQTSYFAQNGNFHFVADKPSKMMSQEMIDCNDGACFCLPER